MSLLHLKSLLQFEIWNYEFRLFDMCTEALCVLVPSSTTSVLSFYGRFTGNKIVHVRLVLLHFTAPALQQVVMCFYSIPNFSGNSEFTTGAPQHAS